MSALVGPAFCSDLSHEDVALSFREFEPGLKVVEHALLGELIFNINL